MSIRKTKSENFMGFPLENSLTRIASLSINFDSNNSQLGAYKYASTAAREEEKITPEEGEEIIIPNNIIGNKGFTVPGLKFTEERKLAIMKIVYDQMAETEGYADGEEV